MSIAGVPDYIGAWIVYLKQFTTEIGVADDRIRGRIPTKLGDTPVQAKTPFVVINAAGGFGSNRHLPVMRVRVDVRCYGSTELNAMAIWRRIHTIVEPPERWRNGFVELGCRISDVNLTAAPVPLVDQDWGTDWPFVIAPYMCEIWEVALV